MELDYTTQGRRPSVAQILADWKRGGKPQDFTVEYGETFAHFERLTPSGPWGSPRWVADGNGCSGVRRDKVEAALNATEQVRP